MICETRTHTKFLINENYCLENIYILFIKKNINTFFKKTGRIILISLIRCILDAIYHPTYIIHYKYKTDLHVQNIV